MKMTEHFSVAPGFLAAFVLAAAAHGPVLAQSDTKTLSGKGGTSGKVMTRDELRACMKQQSELARRKTEIDSRQGMVSAERTEIDKETAALKVDQQALSSRKGDVDSLNHRLTAFGAKVKDLNQRREEFERSGRGGPNAERERRKLDKEAGDIKTEETELNAERDKMMSGSTDAVTAINARVDAQQQKAQGWNDRSRKLTTDQQTYEDDRINWVDSCANRRYRENDEKAIQLEK